VDCVERAQPARSESSRRKQQVAVEQHLVERIEMGEGDALVAVDSTNGSKHLGDRQLAGHDHVVGAQAHSPGGDGALSFSKTANFTMAEESRYQTLTARGHGARQEPQRQDAASAPAPAVAR